MVKKKKKKIRRKPVIFSWVFIVGLVGFYLSNSVAITIGSIIGFYVTLWIVKGLVKKIWKSLFGNTSMEDIDEMDGIEFEYFLCEVFEEHGYRAEVTKASGDFGADLILYKKEDIIVIQAKRYSGNVGVKAVQEVVAATPYYHGTDAWVVSNSYFTKSAIELADRNDVLLIDRDALMKLI